METYLQSGEGKLYLKKDWFSTVAPAYLEYDSKYAGAAPKSAEEHFFQKTIPETTQSQQQW